MRHSRGAKGSPRGHSPSPTPDLARYSLGHITSLLQVFIYLNSAYIFETVLIMCHCYLFTSVRQKNSAEHVQGSMGKQAACTPPGIPQQHSGGYKLKPSSSVTSGKALFFRKKN